MIVDARTVARIATALVFVALCGCGEIPTRDVPDASPELSTVSPVPGNVPPDADVQFVFTFVDAEGTPVVDVPVSVSTTVPSATFTPPSGRTTATGQFVAVFRASAAGAGTVSAVVGDATITPRENYTVVQLCPAPLPMQFPGTVNGVQPCGAYAEGVVAPSVYEFTTTGGGAAFTITSTFEPLYQVKLNATSNDPAFATNLTPWTEEWLLPAGTYLYSVSSLTGSGTFELTGAAVAANTGDYYRTIVAQGTYTGQELGMGDHQFTDDQSYYDGFYFRSASPCTLTLRSTAYAPFFSIRNANNDGQRVTDDVASQIGVDAVIQLSQCRTGNNDPLLIVSGSVETGMTGAYTLIVELTPPAASRAGETGAARQSIERVSRAGVGAPRVPLRKSRR